MNTYCDGTRVRLILWRPLLLAKWLGIELARSKSSDAMSGGLIGADEAVIEGVREVAGRKGWKMSQVALGWFRGKGCVSVVGLICGHAERLDEACAVGEKLHVPKPVAGHF